MSPKTELPPELGDGYELTFARLQRMFRARGVSRDDAADLAQETAARLIVHLRRRGLDPNPFHEGIGALIHRIAMNLLIDRVRAGRERALPLDEATGLPGDDDPAEVVTRRQRVRAVRSAVESLPSRHKRALTLALDGLGPAEIAEDFGIERNAADALLYRARRRLAQSLRLDQIGVLAALAAARVRGALRRGDVVVASSGPGGMNLAAGLVGMAMSASFVLPAASPVVAAASPVVPSHARVAAVPAGMIGATLIAGAPSSAAGTAGAATRRREVTTVRAGVPGSRSDKDQAGIDIWQEHDGDGTTGRIVSHGREVTCSTGACSGSDLLR